MVSRRFGVTVFVLLTAGMWSRGQVPGSPNVPGTPVPTTPLTLAEAEAIAFKNHPQIATARNVAEAAAQGITQAKAAYYPTIDGQITGSQGLNLSRLGAGALSASLLFDRFGQGVQATQLLTDFGRTKNLVANSKLQSQAADQSTQASIYDVALGVHRAYFGVLQAQAFVDVANETVLARQTLTDQVTALFNAKLKSQVDLSFAQVNLSEAKLLVIRSQDAVKRAYADLARALGVEQSVAYKLTDVPPPPPPPPDPEALIATAIQNRPELGELRLRLQAAQSFEKAEADLSHPNVSAIAVGGGLPYLNQNPRDAPHEYEGAAVNVDIPIFNGHLFTARKEAAHYQALASGQRLRNLQQQIERDVRAAWVGASTAFERMPVTEELLKQAQLALELAQDRYNLGLASIVEITQAQLNLTQAQIEEVTAKYDYQTAYAELQYTTGALR